MVDKMLLSKTALERTRMIWMLGLATVILAIIPPSASGQYFGRNKVQFDDFDFEVLRTDHFDIHYYPEEAEAVLDAARMGERWYERLARTFQHEFERTKPIILYADHPDFQQTNTLSGFIGEGTGGVTESLKNRVIMPLAGSYWDTDHVLGHELVHAFQYNIAQSRRGGGLQGLTALPLWLIEGMAEYLSVGRDDPLTGMWIRDAIRRDDLPTIDQMTRESRFFPYRFGQALWAYIGGTYGDDAVVQIYRRSLRTGFEGAIEDVLGLSTDTLSVRWYEKVSEEYLPLMDGRSAPHEQGNLILAPSTGSGSVNIQPSISPDGRYLAFLSEKDIFSVDLYMADAKTGQIIRKLASADSDPHVEALRSIDSSGTWSPNSEQFAYIVSAGGKNQMSIAATRNGVVQRRIEFEDRIGAVSNPSWSPDGRYIAFSGSVGGITDLFIYDLESDETTQLTQDKYADLQPSWSPDGRTIAFTSDRGAATNFELLVYNSFQLALIDVATAEVRTIPLFGNVKHINPQFGDNGESLYFISDQDGFSNVYKLNLEDNRIRRVTNLATGVSGHTYLAPAMSVASQSQLIAYTVFDELEFHIYTKDISEESPEVTVVQNAEDQIGRKLPPTTPDRFSRIATYLADAETGLLPSDKWPGSSVDQYESGLTLDFVGQPSLGVGTDNFGNYVGGGASAYFSDMLGDRVLGTALMAQGTFKDIGGQLFYTDLSDRWNWGVGGGRIPYQMGWYDFGFDDIGSYYGLNRFRIFTTSVNGQVAYPFSSSQRVEFSLGAIRYSYDIEIEKYYTNNFGQIYSYNREDVDEHAMGLYPLNMAQASAALVGDNTTFGFVSPIRGGRYRFSIERTHGYSSNPDPNKSLKDKEVTFTTVVADWRRYFSPTKNLTIGLRTLHYGRYGLSAAESSSDGFGMLRPLFLGYETFIRGYSYESFSASECNRPGSNAGGTCMAFNRLQGQQLAVANLEFRIPLVGVEQYGLINFQFAPIELVAFADAGLAWDSDNPPVLEFTRSGYERVPVFSTGISARANILGFLILEAYYAYPWQRPQKGWHWGFNIAPGW